jgi:hypothetical protein
MLVAGVVNAEWCTGYMPSQTNVGIRGNQGIRTSIPTINGVSDVHTAQVTIDANTHDFVAIGTVQGKGAGANPACTSHYDPGADWTGFYDYQINGIYGCVNFCPNCYHINYAPSFVILYTSCPGIGNRWVMTFAGSQRGCIVGPSNGIQIVAGIETNTLTDRNIDASWTSMQANHGVGWVNVGNTAPGYADSNYTYQYVSNSAWNTFLAPLE